MSHHRTYRLPVLLGVAALLVAACGGDDGASDDAGNGGTNNESTSENDDGASGRGDGAGGIVTVASQRPITTLDPHADMGADLGTQLAGRAIFERLVGATDDGYEPELAAEWTVSDDATEWEFTLRDDAVFSDGTPVTSADVVASIERIQELEGPVSGNVAGVEMEAPDDATVVFTSEAGNPALLGQLTNVWIAPAEHLDEEGFFADPIGSGPYLVESFTPEETLALAPNPDYWGGEPDVEGIEIQFIPEIAARMTALRTGEVDLTWGVPDDQVPALQEEGGLAIETVPSNATYTMWINSGRDAFADAEVRRALWQAVNFEEIIQALHPETGELADSIVAPPVLGYSPQESVEYDPAAAQAALEDAGFDFDATYELQLRGSEFREFAQAVSSELRAIGVQV
ncbi:ABC transporter substrate-binding protein, partial [Phytoactinopolyspora endophytica]|uniref:ABC transporter substrate-binding protein n=1 Tax=Phytoactinopolyspora endophytica TaxID=1642495 RepID=UPI0013EB52E0